jgi:hypothetical protein
LAVLARSKTLGVAVAIMVSACLQPVGESGLETDAGRGGSATGGSTTSGGATGGSTSGGSTTGGSVTYCDAGPCTTVTGASGTCCNGQCTDTLSDSENCGGCGLGCGDASYPNVRGCCAGQCTSLFWDSMNCGRCGVRCPSWGSCSGGWCEASFCYDAVSCCGNRSMMCNSDQACCNDGARADWRRYQCVDLSQGVCPPDGGSCGTEATGC